MVLDDHGLEVIKKSGVDLDLSNPKRSYALRFQDVNTDPFCTPQGTVRVSSFSSDLYLDIKFYNASDIVLKTIRYTKDGCGFSSMELLP